MEKNETFHLRVIEHNDNEPFRASSEPVEETTEYDTYPDTDAESSRFKSLEQAGHFVLSLHKDRTPKLPSFGLESWEGIWRIAGKL